MVIGRAFLFHVEFAYFLLSQALERKHLLLPFLLCYLICFLNFKIHLLPQIFLYNIIYLVTSEFPQFRQLGEVFVPLDFESLARQNLLHLFLTKCIFASWCEVLPRLSRVVIREHPFSIHF